MTSKMRHRSSVTITDETAGGVTAAPMIKINYYKYKIYCLVTRKIISNVFIISNGYLLLYIDFSTTQSIFT